MGVATDRDLVVRVIGDVALADASKRAVGETLERLSVSPSTTELNEGPDPGTPQRVQGRREEAAG